MTKLNEKSIKRVFLLETSLEEQNTRRGEKSEENNVPYPVGLTYLDAILRKEKYEVITKDYTLWREHIAMKSIKDVIERFKPDVVGFSVMTMTRVSTYHAIKLIQTINPKVKIVLGGMHPSMMYEQLLENFPIDFICIGEADYTLTELFDTINKKGQLEKVKGIAYKKDGKVFVTEERKLNFNLDNLPFPSYDIFMNTKIKHVMMITSRGCPNKCSFCCLHITGKQVWRMRNPNKVVDEIEHLVKNYPWIERIEFIDDTITLHNKRVVEICKEIIRRKIRLKFQCQGRIKPISSEMIYWMEKAGFDQIGFGIETGSPKLLKSINKNITQEDCFETFRILRKFKKINVAKYLMVGFPGENSETIKETIEFVKKLDRIKPTRYFYASPLWVYPGTEVYETMKREGMINDNYWITDKPCPLYTVEHSANELIKMSNRIALETMIARGKFFFLKELIKRLAKNPKYYWKRIFGKADNF